MLVSVIIPVYNCRAYILESVRSVQEQTYGNIEIIIVDDGSTDGTQDVLESVKDSRIRLVRTENRGVSAARNTGMEASAGDYMAFIDADDKWFPRKLELQMAMMREEQNLGLVFSDFIRFTDSGVMPRSHFSYVPELQSIRKRPVLGNTGYVIEEDTFSALCSVDMFATWVQTVLLKKEKVKDLRFPVGVRLSEDYNYMLRVYQNVEAGFIAEPLVAVRRHNKNSYTSPEEMLYPSIQALYDVKKNIRDRNHKRIIRKRLSRAWASFGYHHYWKGKTASAGHAYLVSLIYPGCRINSALHLLMLPFAVFLKKKKRLMDS